MTTQSKWRVTEFLKPDEVLALLSVVIPEEDRLLLRTLWETGGRAGEVVRLVPERVDLKNHCILLHNFKQNKRKTPDQPVAPHPLKRIYLFPESTLCQDLLDHCKASHIKAGEWVFPSRMDPSKPFSRVTLWRMVTTAAAELGIRYVKKDPRTGEYRNKPAWPHLFRHSAAHVILDRTGRLDIVRDQLGHASISTTQVYASMSDEQRKKIIRGEERQSVE